MRVAIGGASGLLGSKLTKALRDEGHEVVELVRRPSTKPEERSWDPTTNSIEAPGLADVDAVVNLAGASIAGSRWTESYKQKMRDSRVQTTKTVVEALRQARKDGNDRCETFLSASAMGIYGFEHGGEILTETSPQGTGFLAHVCESWEGAAKGAEDLGVRVAYLRTSNVMSNVGGMLPVLRIPFLLGLGGRIGTGKQWFSWITAEDHVRAMLFLLKTPISGPVNMTAPHPVQNEEFISQYAGHLNRPAFIPFPKFAAGLVLTKQMVDETIAAGQRVVPRVLEEAGFTWNQPTMKSAMRWLETEPK